MAPPRLLRLLPLVLVSCALLGAGCGDSSEGSGDEESRTNLVVAAEREPAVKLPKDKSPEKLAVRDLREGTGIEARKGDVLITKFVAKYTDGERFESSWDPGENPFLFELGAEESNPGWEKGMRGMRVGGKRELIVPSDMASRFGPLDEESDVVYVVELIGVIPPELVERQEPKVVPPKGAPPEDLRARDIIEGTGAVSREGDLLTVEYVGITYDGKEVVTNSWERPKPFRFELGAGDSLLINPGWEKGIPGMRVGGRRELIVPPKLLQEGGASPDSKPSDSWVYVIDLIGITEPDDVRK
jgi:peptidylprolyl isomerase